MQYRANKIGGFIGDAAQMQHLNVSRNRTCMPNGIFDFMDSARIASVLVFMVQGGARNSAISHLATTKNYRDSLGVGGVLVDLLW